MAFPIYLHDLKPAVDGRDSRARHAARNEDVGVSDERPSIWKRELSFGRRKHQPESEATVAPFDEPEFDDETLVDEPEPESERRSIWKREVSFGRKRGQDDETPVDSQTPNEEAAFDADQVLDDGFESQSDHRSIWKRELSFGRKHEPDRDPELDAEPSFEEHAESPQVEEPATEPEPNFEPWSAPPELPPAEDPAPLPAAETFSPEPTAEPAPEAWFEPEGTIELEREPANERRSIWKRELSFGRKSRQDDEAALDVEPALNDLAQPAPIIDHEPEPEVEQSPATDDARPSIWKRELSFGRQKRDWEFEDSAEHGTDVTPVDRTFESEPLGDAWPAPLDEEPVDEPALVPVAASFAPEPDVTYEETELEPVFETTTDSFEVAHENGATESKKNKKQKKSTSSRSEKRSGRGSKGGKKLVGLKVGASQIAAAVVQTNGTHEVLKMARTSLDRGVVVAGEVRDPDALAAALRTFFSNNKLPKRDIRLGIASNRVGVRVLDVTGVEDPDLLGNAVRFRAQEVLPIPLSEAVLDYRVLRERTEEDGTVTYEVLVAFAYRELVDRYASVCRLAGLRLVGIDLDGFALLRALVDPNLADGRLGGAAVVTVALGHDRAIMSVSDGAVCEFTRVIEWGGGSLDIAVARVLALTPSQAEPIKRQLTLDRNTSAPEGLSADQASRARAAMVQEVHAFAREFVSSLQFYQAQPRSLDIGEIVVTGGTAHMPGLVEQLHELIGVSVRIGDPLARVNLGKNVNGDEQVGSLALAIGLGIED